MSFDLEWVDLPEPAASARARYDECADVTEDCRHAPDCFEAYHELVAPYRRHSNIAGMSVVRTWMRRASMTYQADHQPFPEWPFASVEAWHQASAAERAAYNAMERATAAQTVPGLKGIPEFKTLTNGPWIVSTGEISEALDAYRAAPAELRSEAEAELLWNSWLDWLRETEQHGGFHVM